MADSQRKSSVLHKCLSSEVKRAEQGSDHSARRFCGGSVVGLGFGLFAFVLLAGSGGVVFETVTPAVNGNGLERKTA